MVVIGSFPSATLPSPLPSWACYLDGNQFPSNDVSQSLGLNNVELCSLNIDPWKATPSNLTVAASGTTDSPFLFDRIEYVPDTSVILDNATVVVDAFYDQINYTGWSRFGQIGMETSVQGSSLFFDFVGAFCL